VGRGAEQSFCILMTAVNLSRDSKKRMDTMVRTNDGFEIAEVDLELRGPGDIEGTQQSGVLGLRLADIAKDVVILQHARAAAGDLLEGDPKLESDENQALVQEMNREKTSSTNWSKIS
jgi:ATP-dependent DNA helicase RecG